MHPTMVSMLDRISKQLHFLVYYHLFQLSNFFNFILYVFVRTWSKTLLNFDFWMIFFRHLSGYFGKIRIIFLLINKLITMYIQSLARHGLYRGFFWRSRGWIKIKFAAIYIWFLCSVWSFCVIDHFDRRILCLIKQLVHVTLTYKVLLAFHLVFWDVRIPYRENIFLFFIWADRSALNLAFL